jgi:hypothetical protein
MVKVLVMIALIAAASLDANARDQAGAQETTICMINGTKVAPDTLWVAKLTAAKIFASARIVIRWSDRGDCPAGGITMEFRTGAPNTEAPGALGSARPFAQDGVRMTIYADRVSAVCSCTGLAASVILGHAMAHEIGHVLLGTDGHSPSGVMKANWVGNDRHQMVFKYLSFTTDEANMMREGLHRRVARGY